jgi:hypothetical protein
VSADSVVIPDTLSAIPTLAAERVARPDTVKDCEIIELPDTSSAAVGALPIPSSILDISPCKNGAEELVAYTRRVLGAEAEYPLGLVPMIILFEYWLLDPAFLPIKIELVPVLYCPAFVPIPIILLPEFDHPALDPIATTSDPEFVEHAPSPIAMTESPLFDHPATWPIAVRLDPVLDDPALNPNAFK